MKFDTHSEAVFAEICRENGYHVKKRLSRSDKGLRSADFEVSTSFGCVLAEVKELCSNEDDKRQQRELSESGSTSGGGKIGARARQAIREASKQLKVCESRIPKVAVLYNNISFGYPMMHLQPYDIGAAMFGDLVVTVSLNQRKNIIPDKIGGNRTLTDSMRKYLSAVIVISDADDRSLCIYHNVYADYPLYAGLFSQELHQHFKMTSEGSFSPWEWDKIG